MIVQRTTAILHGIATSRSIPLDGSAASVFTDEFIATLRRAPDQVWRVISLEWKSVR